MPIKIPNDLPALKTLDAEGVMVLGDSDAVRQDIRPMRIGLLNLMPNKERTEIQFARLLGSTPLQVELTLVKLESHIPANTPASHMQAFYRSWNEIRDEKFDGFIITGAPVETLPFEQVKYWPELCAILDWTQTNVHGTFTVCWGAQAAMHRFYGTPKHQLANKAFGIYRHRNRAPNSPYLRGFSDDFSIPVSRWTEVRADELPEDQQLRILMESDEAGLCLLDDPNHRMLHMFNHIEYDSDSLAAEYFRDRDAGMDTLLPVHYFPDDDPSRPPENRWRSHAHLLFGNWINQIYQTTPFNAADIGTAQIEISGPSRVGTATGQ